MIKSWLKNKILELYPGSSFDVLATPNQKMGDYSVNLAFWLAKKENKTPIEIGQELVKNFIEDDDFKKKFSKIEFVNPGFINFFLKKEFLQSQLKEIANNKNYGLNDAMKGKTVLIEYTDPNPFKLFHIGHLMSNIIGEAIARLYEASGARIIRATWQGDVGTHIAMAVWAIKSGKADPIPAENYSLEEKMDYLGKAYVAGAAAYKEENSSAKKEIDEINKKIYSKEDSKINNIYNMGRKWSLDYFEKIYERLGSKFDNYFFESELGQKGLEIVKNHSDIFEESEGAIVFRGEKYGLHTRVFINSSGLPVYESKELGLNREKFDRYNPDLSIIITGNEVNDYFKVLFKVMELVMPDVASKTRHLGHGMLRLLSGKMSSREGNIITADFLIEQTKNHLPETESFAKSKIAIGAIKYSILKQNPGRDIVFDFEKSLSVKGDSGPYLQYSYARLNNIIKKSGNKSYNLKPEACNLLTNEFELNLIKQLLKFPDFVEESGREIAPQHLALYVYELANNANRFYEEVRVLEDDNQDRLKARLVLVKAVAGVLERGLKILGIDVLDRI